MTHPILGAGNRLAATGFLMQTDHAVAPDRAGSAWLLMISSTAAEAQIRKNEDA